MAWSPMVTPIAASNAGGLGITGGNVPKEAVKANIDKVKSIIDKPLV